MIIRYQIILLGSTKSSLVPKVLSVFFGHLKDLGVSKASVKVLTRTNFNRSYKGIKSPTYCIYFGRKGTAFKDLELLERLIKDACLIIPVVRDIESFKDSTPILLHKFNGFQLRGAQDIEALVAHSLEGLSLLRISRRLFISYKRNESSIIAVQLFDQFAKHGFDVFLDTHSIRGGEPFQDELWHRLADTDVVILLNTPGFMDSRWTTEELARANSMSIGIFQAIWPKHRLERDAKISLPLQLKESDFGNKIYSKSKQYLTSTTLSTIVDKVESLRARSLAARQTNIITEFVRVALSLNIPVTVQPSKYIVLRRKDKKELIIIPTIGIPQAFTYYQSEEIVKKIKSKKVAATYLLYDHINIRERWLTHLDWLDDQLRVKTIRIFNVREKLQRLMNETKKTK